MGKKVPQKLEIVIVGLQHRLTPSTRRMLASRVEEDILEASIDREPDNSADENAIRVILSSAPYKGMHIGYIPRGVAAVMAPAIDDGHIEIESAKGSITEVDPPTGTATMLLEFKAPVKVKAKGSKGGKRKTA